MRNAIRILFILLFSITALPTWAEDEEVKTPEVIYYQFPAKPAIRVDFSSQSEQKVRLLQIEVAVMAHNQEIIDLTERNLPMLEHGLRRLLSKQTMAGVNTIKGREALQKSALKTIKALLKEETGQDSIDNIYFTSFILQ